MRLFRPSLWSLAGADRNQGRRAITIDRQLLQPVGCFHECCIRQIKSATFLPSNIPMAMVLGFCTRSFPACFQLSKPLPPEAQSTLGTRRSGRARQTPTSLRQITVGKRVSRGELQRSLVYSSRAKVCRILCRSRHILAHICLVQFFLVLSSFVSSLPVSSVFVSFRLFPVIEKRNNSKNTLNRVFLIC